MDFLMRGSIAAALKRGTEIRITKIAINCRFLGMEKTEFKGEASRQRGWLLT